MPSCNKRIYFGDDFFDLFDAVYEPAEDTFLFGENLEVKDGDQVLDMGTGCGLLGILAAKNAKNVIAVDLNPNAIQCAKMNAKLNHVQDKIHFVQSSLFSALNLKASFDLILFNSPYLPSEDGEESSWIGRSWAGGPSGRNVVDRFITQVPLHLKRHGRILLMQSTLTGLEETIEKFGNVGLFACVKAERKLPFFETLILVEAKAKD
jgi:release factor glutamine methyltransferase